MIRLENIRKTYKMGDIQVHALDGISMEISQGEALAIVGPSGSGKSTLMNIIGCLDTPTSGSYVLNGRAVSGLSKNELAGVRNTQIGFVFQSYNLLPRQTALENVELPLIYRGLPGKVRREYALAALEKVGLTGRMHHRPTELSGGQQQRVAIARALVGDSPVILADEPTGNLDSASGREVMNVLTKLHSQGKTLILITHDPQVAKLAQRQVRIIDGRLETGGAY
ncbi:MAG: ABC transporter ATP-binding protein [Dethiobacter sp.]|nr:ABC transporter ATP-binding protein [Dethiobacter sp.]MBS3897726.1 ABC transporter ATP-binding protein [Dethiobacter sp.]